MGYVFSRAICISAGFLYPAYKHFKFLKSRAQSDSLDEEDTETSEAFNRHWLTIAAFCALELLSDYSLFWIPLYNELKIVLVLWISLPFTQV